MYLRFWMYGGFGGRALIAVASESTETSLSKGGGGPLNSLNNGGGGPLNSLNNGGGAPRVFENSLNKGGETAKAG